MNNIEIHKKNCLFTFEDENKLEFRLPIGFNKGEYKKLVIYVVAKENITFNTDISVSHPFTNKYTVGSSTSVGGVQFFSFSKTNTTSELIDPYNVYLNPEGNRLTIEFLKFKADNKFGSYIDFKMNKLVCNVNDPFEVFINSDNDECILSGKDIEELLRKYRVHRQGTPEQKRILEKTREDSLRNDLINYIKTDKELAPKDYDFRLGLDHTELLSKHQFNKVLLKSRAGGGKSVYIGKIALSYLYENYKTIVIQLRSGFDDEDIVILNRTNDKYAKIDVLLKNSIIPISSSNLTGNKNFILIVDGLNELTKSISKIVLKLIDDIYREYTPQLILVTDRLIPRDLDRSWRIYDFPEVPKGQIKKILEAKISNIQKIEKMELSILQVPFFLDIAIKNEKPELSSSIQALNDFFLRILENYNQIDRESLFNASFIVYDKARSRTFSVVEFQEHVNKSIFDKLNSSGIVTIFDDKCYFNHQLFHDFLSSKHLSKNQKLWSGTNFDIISLQGNSFDALSLVLEQIDDKEQGDCLLKLMYNWNWLAPLACIYNVGKHVNANNYSEEIKQTLMIAQAEKLADEVKGTRERIEYILELFPEELAKVKDTRDINDVIDYFKKIDSKLDWFNELKEYYIRDKEKGFTEEEIFIITSNDSILGWMMSNILRRSELKKEDFRQLRTIYSSLKAEDGLDNERIEINRAVRWRVVHTLGRAKDEQSVKLLFDALKNDSYEWTRYGAARSLVEIAARNDNEIRNIIIAQLCKIIYKLSETIKNEIGRVVFYNGAVDDWKSEGKKLLDKIYASYNESEESVKGKLEKWEEIISSFQNDFNL